MPNSLQNCNNYDLSKGILTSVEIPFIRVVDPLSWTEIPTIIGTEASIWKEMTTQKIDEFFNIDLEGKSSDNK